MPVVYSGLNERLSSKRPSRHTKPSMATDNVSCSWVLSCRHQACLCKLRADGKEEEVATLMYALLIRKLYRKNIYLSKKPAAFLRDMMSIQDTAAAGMNVDLWNILQIFWEKVLQLRDGPLALSFFAQRRKDLLKPGHTILESLVGITWASLRLRHIFSQPDSFYFITIKSLECCMVSTFLGEDALKGELVRRFWSQPLIMPFHLSTSQREIELLLVTHH